MGLRKIDVVSIPVSDVDRAKAFYAEALGFTLNIDNPIGDGMRWVQLTPPGGGASIALITWNADMPPGAIKDLYLACDDIEATAATLAYPVRQVRALRRSGREWVATSRGAVAARRSGCREQSTSAL